jgi:hypothetical protein
MGHSHHQQAFVLKLVIPSLCSATHCHATRFPASLCFAALCAASQRYRPPVTIKPAPIIVLE